MSTLRIASMADRVVVIHDMTEQTIFCELDTEQAGVLLEQLQLAVGQSLAAQRERAGNAPRLW